MAILIYILRKLILFLIKIRIITPARQRKYVIHTKVYLDGKKMIKEFPSELISTSRRAAKKHIASKITFTTGTEAFGGKWHGAYREFYVQLYVRYEGKIIHSFAVAVMAKKSREAKFDITKRLSFKMGAAALKLDLKKHA